MLARKLTLPLLPSLPIFFLDTGRYYLFIPFPPVGEGRNSTRSHDQNNLPFPPCGGRSGWGGSQISSNNLFYLFNIIHDIIVPKPYHFKSLRTKPFCAQMVIILIDRMLSAIHFNDQPLFKAYEIKDIFSDGGLPSKP